jgi:hypothetical protein
MAGQTGIGVLGSTGYQPLNFSQSSPQNFYNPVNSQMGLPGMDGLETLGQYGTPNNLAPPTDYANMFQGISQGLGAFTSLAQIYGMFQSLGLQKKAFKFAQEGTKRNFNAQATAYNEAVASKETARHAYADANNQDYGSMYAYGTGQKVEKWT